MAVTIVHSARLAICAVFLTLFASYMLINFVSLGIEIKKEQKRNRQKKTAPQAITVNEKTFNDETLTDKWTTNAELVCVPDEDTEVDSTTNNSWEIVGPTSRTGRINNDESTN